MFVVVRTANEQIRQLAESNDTQYMYSKKLTKIPKYISEDGAKHLLLASRYGFIVSSLEINLLLWNIYCASIVSFLRGNFSGVPLWFKTAHCVMRNKLLSF